MLVGGHACLEEHNRHFIGPTAPQALRSGVLLGLGDASTPSGPPRDLRRKGRGLGWTVIPPPGDSAGRIYLLRAYFWYHYVVAGVHQSGFLGILE